MGKAAMGYLTTIWKDTGIKLTTRVKLANALVFPIVLYGAMRKAESKKIDAFDTVVLEASDGEKHQCVGAGKHFKPEWTLESRVAH